jgi:hypothetical protein
MIGIQAGQAPVRVKTMRGEVYQQVEGILHGDVWKIEPDLVGSGRLGSGLREKDQPLLSFTILSHVTGSIHTKAVR